MYIAKGGEDSDSAVSALATFHKGHEDARRSDSAATGGAGATQQGSALGCHTHQRCSDALLSSKIHEICKKILYYEGVV